MLIGIIHDMGNSVILHKAVVYNLVTIAGAFPAGDLADRTLVIQDGPDPLGSAVTFGLVDGKHDVDDHLPVGRRGIIIFEDGPPVAMMGLENLLRDVIVLDVAEPTVKLCDQDHVDLILLHVF